MFTQKTLVQIVKALLPKRHLPRMLEIYLVLNSLFYIGDMVKCPCCRGSFRKFLPHGVKTRPNALCPRCNSAERHRLMWLYLKNRTNLFSENLKVLHFAPEYAFRRILGSMSNIEYTSADLHSSLAMVNMDITNILYEDDSFDVILCSHVLEHVPNDQKAMSELFRVLKRGGWAIIQSPVDSRLDTTLEDANVVSPEDREQVFGASDHVRVYGLDYKNRLEEAGFVVKIDSYAAGLESNIIKRYGLKVEDIYLCRKPLMSA